MLGLTNWLKDNIIGVVFVLLGGGLIGSHFVGGDSAPVTVDAPSPEIKAAGLPVDLSKWTVASIPVQSRRPPKFEQSARPLGIVGGVPADWKNHPGAVRMQAVNLETEKSYGGQLCGGTAIDRNWIITAAHCVKGAGLIRFDFWYGANEWREATMVHGYVAYAHPAYKAIGYSGDAALVKLETPLPAEFPVARLATADEYAALEKGTRMIVRGWGTTRGAPDGGRNPADALQEVEVVIHGTNPLQSTVKSADGAERNACQGDSGGGMVRKDGDPAVIYGPLSTVQPTAGGICVGEGYLANYTASTFVRAF